MATTKRTNTATPRTPRRTTTPALDRLNIPRRTVPKSMKRAAGILKGKNIDPHAYQRTIRKEWDARWRKQVTTGTTKSKKR